MASRKDQRPKRARKANAHLRGIPRRRSRAAGSRVGDDLVEALEQMVAHLRGEIELEDVTPPIRSPITKQTTPSS